jgi:hypothetical protein
MGHDLPFFSLLYHNSSGLSTAAVIITQDGTPIITVLNLVAATPTATDTTIFTLFYEESIGPIGTLQGEKRSIERFTGTGTLTVVASHYLFDTGLDTQLTQKHHVFTGILEHCVNE